MAPMSYDNESEPVGGSAEPGRYRYKVDEAEETRFSTGSKGVKATLLVAIGRRDLKCFVNFSYKEKALWKLKEFMTSIGMDYHAKNEVHDLVGKIGVADFGVNENGYLEAKKFLPDGEVPDDEPAHPTERSHISKPRPSAAAKSADDVPF